MKLTAVLSRAKVRKKPSYDHARYRIVRPIKSQEQAESVNCRQGSAVWVSRKKVQIKPWSGAGGNQPSTRIVWVSIRNNTITTHR